MSYTVTVSKEQLDLALKNTMINKSHIPKNFHREIQKYLLEGGNPGPFLGAVFADSLKAALSFNYTNATLDEIQAILTLFYFLAPNESYGSTENVENWVAGFEKMNTIRTIVYVVSCDENKIYAQLPAWYAPETIVEISKKSIPMCISSIAIAGKRLHAEVNLGAKAKADLLFTNWETS